MVQNKEAKVSYKSKKKVYVLEASWIIMENIHEPLVDKSTFNEINNNCNKFTRYSKEKQCISHFMSYAPLEEVILKRVKHTLKSFIDNLDIEHLAKEINKRMGEF